MKWLYLCDIMALKNREENIMSEFHPMKIAGLDRKLKKFPVSDTLDIAAFILFVPFGFSAFFCLKQFRHAALWCFESWYCWIAAYFYYATGCHWNAWLPRLLHFPELGIDIQTIISFGFFLLLVFFICMTGTGRKRRCGAS